MKINELLDEYQVTLYLFPETMWERRGFYFPDERIIYVNGNLTQEEREEVILHELGRSDVPSPLEVDRFISQRNISYQSIKR